MCSQCDKYNPRCNARSPTSAYLPTLGHPSSELPVMTPGNSPQNISPVSTVSSSCFGRISRRCTRRPRSCRAPRRDRLNLFGALNPASLTARRPNDTLDSGPCPHRTHSCIPFSTISIPSNALPSRPLKVPCSSLPAPAPAKPASSHIASPGSSRKKTSRPTRSSQSPSPTRPPAKWPSESIELLGHSSLAKPLISTFHSFCVRILRRDVEALKVGDKGLTRAFTIFDENDQSGLVKQIMKRMGLDTKQLTPRTVLSRISWAKNHMVDPAGLLPRLQRPLQRARRTHLQGLPGRTAQEQRHGFRRPPA